MSNPKNERRINKRVSAKFEISYVHDSDYLISFTKDISADGMFIETDNPPAEGSIIKLIFSLGQAKKIETKAKVIWINKKTSPREHGMGVRFLDMPASVKEELLKAINVVAVL